ncbi:MAG: tetratricopeptide repeat protein [Treponema sp.]|jgi:tetratricopeptide (TPR) repeat protein|nr:tetratricopeptide repeat protein [Treponema sp.]
MTIPPQFTALIQTLITEQGKEVLLNPANNRAFILDYTGSEFARERRLLLRVIEAGAAKAIDAADDLEICKKQQARYLCEEFFMAEEIAADVVDMLALVLRGDKKNSVLNDNLIPKNIPKKITYTPNAGTLAGVQTQAENFYKKGILLYLKGNYERSIKDFTEAIRLDPNFAKAYNKRGEVYNDKGECDQAIADCTEAIRLDPNNKMAKKNLKAAKTLRKAKIMIRNRFGNYGNNR